LLHFDDASDKKKRIHFLNYSSTLFQKVLFYFILCSDNLFSAAFFFSNFCTIKDKEEKKEKKTFFAN
jgi:hypothetical protein